MTQTRITTRKQTKKTAMNIITTTGKSLSGKTYTSLKDAGMREELTDPLQEDP